jgi:hypothetical protein
MLCRRGTVDACSGRCFVVRCWSSGGCLATVCLADALPSRSWCLVDSSLTSSLGVGVSLLASSVRRSRFGAGCAGCVPPPCCFCHLCLECFVLVVFLFQCFSVFSPL